MPSGEPSAGAGFLSMPSTKHQLAIPYLYHFRYLLPLLTFSVYPQEQHLRAVHCRHQIAFRGLTVFALSRSRW